MHVVAGSYVHTTVQLHWNVDLWCPGNATKNLVQIWNGIEGLVCCCTFVVYYYIHFHDCLLLIANLECVGAVALTKRSRTQVYSGKRSLTGPQGRHTQTPHQQSHTFLPCQLIDVHTFIVMLILAFRSCSFALWPGNESADGQHWW